jgi:hypothetical protein
MSRYLPINLRGCVVGITEIYKYAVEVGSGAKLFKPGLIKIGSGIHKVLRGNTHVGAQSDTAR